MLTVPRGAERSFDALRYYFLTPNWVALFLLGRGRFDAAFSQVAC